LQRDFSITPESFDSFTAYWANPAHQLAWDCLFVLPPWLRAWWGEFGKAFDLLMFSVWQADELTGLAPLMVQDDKVRIIGTPDVCDYIDFIVVAGREDAFFRGLMQHLRRQGVQELELTGLRPDSSVLSRGRQVASNLDCEVFCRPLEASFEMDLPADWDDFLMQISGKERHEIRRKFRRLNEAVRADFRCLTDPSEVREQIDVFFELFVMNRADKAKFMNPQMNSYFRSLARLMAQAGLLRLFILDVDNQPAAAVLGFEHDATVYLYNNGYDTRFRKLSVGHLSKVLSIKQSIEEGKRKYDFLKGNEKYKQRLGGKPVPLTQCRIQLN
jgi:CelD/BcsL family acetyltransferase involved in cellulose biosynthesis